MVEKPKCKLSGMDGNVFAIIGKVSRTSKDSGLKTEAEKFKSEAFKQQSYDDVLQLCFDYVEVE